MRRLFVLLIIGVGIAAYILFVYHNRYITDDAFISFRYARNLFEGHGLAYNTGERVEGYTNFLWTILMSLSFILNIEITTFSYILGISIQLITLFFVYLLGKKYFQKKSLGLFLTVLTATNFTFIVNATGGLGTMLQGLWVVLLLYLITIFEKNQQNILLVFGGAISSLAILTRLDSVILIIPLLVYVVLKTTTRKKILFLVIPIIIIVGTYFIWKLSYYGTLLPNTFYAKTNGIHYYLLGFQYVSSFLLSYCLVPITIIFISKISQVIEQRLNLALITSILIWFLYLVYIGGDFMEYRFFVAIIPLIYILTIKLLTLNLSQRLKVIIISCLLISPSMFQHSFKSDNPTLDRLNIFCRFVAKTNIFNQLLNHTTLSWENAGLILAEALNNDPSVSIGITAAGTIPYYSRLPTLDILGLNDAWISRNGVEYQQVPGHRIIAPLNYLIKQNVNLLIGNPTYSKFNNQSNFSLNTLCHKLLNPSTAYDCSSFPTHTKSLEIPLNSEVNLVVIYLTPHPQIDSAIKEYDWLLKDLTD